jgi:polysaccharide biosynthesis/export protein
VSAFVRSFRQVFLALLLASVAWPLAAAQRPAPANSSPATPGRSAAPPGAPTTTIAVPADYVIGPEDVLTIFFWREKDLTQEVAVRPDGRISLPLLNDVEAAGLTPEQLRLRVTEAAERLIEDPTVTVVVKQINSRKVFITGQVGKQGVFALGGPTNVMQLITMAGGVQEYADAEHIIILRKDNGRDISIPFNYKDVKRGKNLNQNILLRPGDTIIVP